MQSHNHLLSVWAYDKDGHKVHPYMASRGTKKGLYSVNFTSDTKKFEGMTEAQVISAIQQGKFRDRGTIRMCRVTVATGNAAFAPVMYADKRIKDF